MRKYPLRSSPGHEIHTSAERDALLEYLPTIDSSRFTVIEMPFVNRPNCPPIPIIILKDM